MTWTEGTYTVQCGRTDEEMAMCHFDVIVKKHAVKACMNTCVIMTHTYVRVQINPHGWNTVIIHSGDAISAQYGVIRRFSQPLLALVYKRRND